MLTSSSSIVALDVGGKRIGVATANAVARIAHPLETLDHNETIMQTIQDLVAREQAAMVVIGFPRNLSGQETEQTRTIQSFGAELEKHIQVPIHWQDESVTSRKAEAELKQRGKPFAKGDIDALAAAYILEDFLTEHPEVKA